MVGPRPRWLVAVLPLLLSACGTEERRVEPLDPAVLAQHLERLRLDSRLPPDPTNRYADDDAAARLGQALFFDPGLSPVGISCATCHDPAKHFADGKTVAVGAGTGNRNTPTVVGSQQGPWFFWDGRADSLWAQALGPIENPLEMAGDRVHAVRRVADAHAELYEAVFGPLPSLEGLPERARPALDDTELDQRWASLDEPTQHLVNQVFVNMGKAIGAYERKLLPQEAPFDRYADAVLAGDPTGGGHLTEAQVRGFELFVGRTNCVSCHNGPMFTDRAFHNLGLPEAKGYELGRTRGAMLVRASPFNCEGPWSDAEDCPELRYLNPTFPDFQSAFKTPTLRDITQTAPYMHHGALETLDDVLEFYSELPTEPAIGHRELTLRPLRLTRQERADLTAFLESLTGGPLPESLTGPPEEEVAAADGG